MLKLIFTNGIHKIINNLNDLFKAEQVFIEMRNKTFLSLFFLILVTFGILACGSVNSGVTVTDSNTDNNNTSGDGGIDDTIDDSTSNNSLGVQDKAFTTDSNQVLKINLSTLVNNVDPTKNYTFTIVATPNNGLVAMQNELLTYTPSVVGSDEIKYKVSDGQNDSNIGKITIVVSSISNGGGVANILELTNKTISTIQDEEVQIELSSMIKNFNSTSSYNFAVTSSPTLGTYKINGFTLTYTPNRSTLGNDQIALRAGDGNSTSNIATIDIKIQDPSNSAPQLQNVSYTISPNTPAVLDLNLLFLPPHPFVGKTYSFSILQQGKLGAGVISGTNLTYTPILNAFGTDISLRILVEDNLGQKSETPITVIISN